MCRESRKWYMNEMEISVKKQKTQEKINWNSGAEKHNNWNEKFTGRIQSHISAGRRKNQQTLRQDNENYWVWGTERKKIEEKWTEPKGSVGNYEGDQHMHWGSPRRRRERISEAIIAENFPNSMKDMNINIKEAQQIPKDELKETHTKTHYNKLSKTMRESWKQQERSDSLHKNHPK